MSLQPPVITGVGIVTAAGVGIDRVWEALRMGRSGLGPLTLFPSPRYGAHAVGQVREPVDSLAAPLRGSRTDKLAWIAAQEALSMAGLAVTEFSSRSQRMGIVLGTTVGGMLGTESWLGDWIRQRRRCCGPLRFHKGASAADQIARQLNVNGPCLTVSTACSAGAMAIATGAQILASGEADLVLVGGADCLSRLTLNGFGSLLLLDPQGCRPFDARRAGLSLGEGAGILVLETEQSARVRGARILARLSGWGASCDAWHATAPQPQGEGALAAMRRALHSSRLLPRDIGYVSAHGTGTPDNDAMESAALKSLFDQAVPPVASLKGFFGHTLAASGALQAVVSVRALQEQGCPGNLGFEQPDPRLGLEPLKTFQPQKLAHILSNSFGFGGNNVALIFSHPEAPVPPEQTTSPRASLPSQRVAVVGAGIVSARAKNFAEIASAYSQDAVAPTLFRLPDGWPVQEIPALSCQPFEENSEVDPAKRRKLSRLQLMMLAAVRQALTPELLNVHARDRVCVALGTGLGALNDTAAFLENLWIKEERAPRPLFFTNSVHNSLASQVAIEWKLTGLNATVTHRETSFDAALWQGAQEITAGRADLALVGAADELNPYYLAVGQRWGWWDPSRNCLPGEASAAFTLADASKAERPLGYVSASRTGRWLGQNSSTFDAAAEAEWVAATLARAGIPLNSVDLFLTAGNPFPSLSACEGRARLSSARRDSLELSNLPKHIETGLDPLDSQIQEIVNVLSGRAKRTIPLGFYQQGCGRLPTASAFGFATALALVRGKIPLRAITPSVTSSDGACRRVILYTLSPAGTKGMCCVCA